VLFATAGSGRRLFVLETPNKKKKKNRGIGFKELPVPADMRIKKIS